MQKKIIIISMFIIIISGYLLISSYGFFSLNQDDIKIINDSNNDELIKNDFVGLEKNLTELNKDIDFYKDLEHYLKLLDKKDYDYFKKSTDSNNSEEIEDIIILIVINNLFKDSEMKNIIENLKKEVLQNKVTTFSKEEEDDLFKKNNSCANLITGITQQLESANKENNDSKSIKKKEKLDFIFYSPTLKNCIYATTYSYSYTDNNNWEKSYSTKTKRMYNVSTKTQLKEFSTYYYKYPYLTEEEQDIKELKERNSFEKFVLENSNYNIDLVSGVSYYD